jgi:hypothetical protein
MSFILHRNNLLTCGRRSLTRSRNCPSRARLTDPRRGVKSTRRCFLIAFCLTHLSAVYLTDPSLRAVIGGRLTWVHSTKMTCLWEVVRATDMLLIWVTSTTPSSFIRLVRTAIRSQNSTTTIWTCGSESSTLICRLLVTTRSIC